MIPAFIKTEVKLHEVSRVACLLAEILVGGDIFTLKGEIGAGKTTLVGQIAKCLGITDLVSSPTFAIVATYPISKEQKLLQQLIHIDTYRLEQVNELYDLGIETLFDPLSVSFIEWGDRITDYIGEDYFVVSIDENSRETRDFSFQIVGDLKDDRRKQISDLFIKDGWYKNV